MVVCCRFFSVFWPSFFSGLIRYETQVILDNRNGHIIEWLPFPLTLDQYSRRLLPRLAILHFGWLPDHSHYLHDPDRSEKSGMAHPLHPDVPSADYIVFNVLLDPFL
jgi:hypothetical protein